jgi:CheY-like chemotaxis protein
MNNSFFHLLHVDDDPSDAFFFRRAWSHCSNTVVLHWAQSGPLAVEYLDRDGHVPPQLVVCDVRMPSMSGFEFLKWLRASRFRRTPVIMMSGSILADDVNTAFDLGANAYLIKPTAPDELLKTIRRIMEFWCHGCVFPSTVSEIAFRVPAYEDLCEATEACHG